MSEIIIASSIQSIGSVLAALLPSLAMVYVGRSIYNKKSAQRTAYNAMKEIQFLKEVEKVHVETPCLSLRQARSLVSKTGLISTGKFTPAKLQRKLESYKTQLSEE